MFHSLAKSAISYKRGKADLLLPEYSSDQPPRHFFARPRALHSYPCSPMSCLTPRSRARLLLRRTTRLETRPTLCAPIPWNHMMTGFLCLPLSQHSARLLSCSSLSSPCRAHLWLRSLASKPLANSGLCPEDLFLSLLWRVVCSPYGHLPRNHLQKP
jgi:hypothetical protein